MPESHHPSPMAFTWDGEAMQPKRPLAADRQYVVGEVYLLAVVEERSWASHGHYFAALGEAWKNLPEELTEQFPTVKHMRKRALIKAGFRDEQSIVCASKSEALRVAAFIRPLDEYAFVLVRDNVVIHLTAKSQSLRAMDKETFQKSKQDVLEIVAGMVKVTREQLEKNAGASA